MEEMLIPVPQVGFLYGTKDGKVYKITFISANEDATIKVCATDHTGKKVELSASEWNAMELMELIHVENKENFESGNCVLNEYQKTLDEIKIRRSEGKSLKGECGNLNEFLWFCAGVDRDLIRTCKSDWASKSAIGGEILSTAILTAMSVGYAASIMTQNMFFVIAIGVLFGLIVFHLDRFVVTTMYSDGKPTISWKEFISGLPRIIIAIFLGLVVAIPIEIHIFRSAINDYIYDCKTKEVLVSPEVVAIDERVEFARNAIANLDSCIHRYSIEYDMETRNPTRSGVGPHAMLIEKKLYAARTEIECLKQKRDSLLMIKSKIVSHAPYTGEVSLSQNIEALYAVTDHGMRYMIRLFVSLLFIIVLIIPVLSKMMKVDGVYDILLSTEREITERIIAMRGISVNRILERMEELSK